MTTTTPPTKNPPVTAAGGAATPPNPPAKPKPTAPIPPTPAKPARPKKSWWKLKLALILLLAGALSIVYYLPDQVEKYTNTTLPAPVKKTIAFIKAKLNPPAETTPTVTAKKPQPTPITPPKKAKTPTPPDNTAGTTGTIATPATTATAAQNLQLQNRIAQLEQQINAMQNRVTSPRLSPEQLNWRLKIIDLELQLNGDTLQAAHALQQLQTTATPALRTALTQERQRLQNMTAKSTVLSAIKATQKQLAQTSQNPTTDATAAQQATTWLKTFFNYKTVTTATTSLSHQQLQEQIKQLEYLLLTRQYDAYNQKLATLHRLPDNQKNNLAQLLQTGTIAYHLTLSIR